MPAGLSPAQQVRHRAYQRAFEIELFNRAAALDGPDPALMADGVASRARFQDAWARLDLSEVVRFGQALAAGGWLKRGDASRLRTALTMLDRADEALAMGQDDELAPRDLLTLASGGRLEQARAEFGKVDPSSDPELMVLLGRALGDAIEPEGVWDPETGPLAAALELGCGELAVDIAARSLKRGAPSAEVLGPALDLLEASFRLASRTGAVRLINALKPLFPPEDRRVWKAVRRLAAGAPDDGRMLEADAGDDPRQGLAHVLVAACAAIGRPEAAIRRLGRFSYRQAKGTEYVAELARLVGEAERLAPRYAPPADRRRIFDVFPFNGEFMLLDLKLEAMADWVDAFVLVEAPRTFTDRPKPLYFQEAKARYAAYADKIIHVVADPAPPFAQAAWTREYHQRDQGVRGLSGRCSPDDLVLISDVDEIANPAALEAFREPFATLGVRTFAYFLNYERVVEARQDRKIGVVQARMLQSSGLSCLRVGMWAYGKRRLADAGWHFSSVLSAQDIELKMLSYSHEEHQRAGIGETSALLIEQIRAGHRDPGFARVPIDATFPTPLQTPRPAYAPFILPEPDPSAS